MTARRFVLLLGLYVTLDLTNPFMPGAFNFNPAESVEGIRPEHEVFRSRLAAHADPLPTRDAALKHAVVAPRPAEPWEPRAVSAWLVDLRQRQSSVSEPPPTEDH